MERNRWETAIRCLEIAVHPNTKDKEVIAAVNGFRRTADGTPLSQLCREFAAVGGDNASAVERKDKLDRLERENLELRRKIEEIETGRTATLHRLREADQRASEISEELLVAERRADAAEQRLAEFQGAYGRIPGGLRHEDFDLRHALNEARRNLAQPIHEPVRPFQNLLNTALQRPDQALASPPTPMSGRPWTA
jgi:septal ring factor EnvC (AmiA/AmiB activator)